MRGQKVIVRAAGNKPLVRLVWESDKEKVYIGSDESYKRLSSLPEGVYLPTCFPIGFPRDCVFCYDEGEFGRFLLALKKDSSAWNSLKVWSEDRKAKSN